MTPRLSSMKLNVAAQAIAKFQNQVLQNVTTTHQNEPGTVQERIQEASGQLHRDVTVSRQSELQSAQRDIAVRELPEEDIQGKHKFHFNAADSCATRFPKLGFEGGLIPFKSQPATMQSLELSDSAKHHYMIYATVNICLRRLINNSSTATPKDFKREMLTILVGLWKGLGGEDIRSSA